MKSDAVRAVAVGPGIRQMLADACPPVEMAAAAVAPARGPMRLVEAYELLTGGTRRRAGAHWQAADVFDRMIRAAWLRHQKAGGLGLFSDPFTPGQVAMARHYRGLVENHYAGGVRCVSLETAGRAGGGAGGAFTDAFVTEGREIAMLRRRVGPGQALVLRRIRPSQRGSKSGIADLALVDLVCVDDLDLTAVLRRHGWAKRTGNLSALRIALGAALDRMQGYRD
ncbi:MAG: hypothetical protein Q8Q26_09625 [Pseudorhodobacter sp.]|nr:hypothetical protein [Pseudorhodobacter sp.]